VAFKHEVIETENLDAPSPHATRTNANAACQQRRALVGPENYSVVFHHTSYKKYFPHRFAI
jgi:hypothetical protein